MPQTIPIPQGATIGKTVPIPQGATIGQPTQATNSADDRWAQAMPENYGDVTKLSPEQRRQGAADMIKAGAMAAAVPFGVGAGAAIIGAGEAVGSKVQGDPTGTALLKGGTAAATTYVGGKAIEALPAVGRLIGKQYRKLAGVPKAVAEAESARVAEIARSTASAKEEALTSHNAFLKTQASNESKQVSYQATKERIDNLNRANESATRQANEAAEAEVIAKNESSASAYRKATGEAIQSRNAQAVYQSRSQAIEKGKQVIESKLAENVKTVKAAVNTELTGRWNVMRSEVGNELGNPQGLQDSILRAKAEVSAANAPELDATLTKVTGDLPSRSFTWTEAQATYTRLNQELFAGNLSGDVRRVLFPVREQLAAQLEAIAETKGLGSALRKLKADQHGYLTTFEDLFGIGKGGSPLAHSAASPDAPTAARHLTGAARDRAIALLAQYKNYGARPDLFSIRDRVVEMGKSLPKPPAVKFPGERPTPVDLPQGKATPYAVPPEPPTMEQSPEFLYSGKNIKTLPKSSPSDIEKAKLREFKRKIGKRTAQALGAGTAGVIGYELTK